MASNHRSAIKRVARKLAGQSTGVERSANYLWTTWSWITLAQAQRFEPEPAYVEVAPPESIYRRPPVWCNDTLHWRFVNRLYWQSPATFVALIPDGRALGSDAAVVTPDGKLLVDVSFWGGVDIGEHHFFGAPRGSPVHVAGDLIVLSAPKGNSYFHWMFDVLPRIDVLRRSGRYPGGGEQYLVNGLGQPFQRESFRHLGICHEDVVESSKIGAVVADRLWVPSFPGTTGEMPASSWRFLRETFLEDRAAPKPRGRGERLYVSRGDGRRRRIINEFEVLAALKKLGFSAVEPGSMSIEEQAALFASAEAIVAPHGGALTNLVFCEPDTKVIELFHRDYINVCYWSLACLGRLPYACIVGNGAAQRLGKETGREKDGIRVDIAGYRAGRERPGTEFQTSGSGAKDIVVDVDVLLQAIRHLELT